MIRLLASAALIALAGISSLPATTPLPAKSYSALEDLRFTIGEANRNGTPTAQLQFTREGRQGYFGSVDAADLMGQQALAALSSPGSAIAFTVAREAGTLACHGQVSAPGTAAGTCRFDPDQGFAERLAAKGLQPEDDDDLLGATLVDARIAQVEDLERLGYEFGEFSDMIAIAALEVTPDFAQGLRAAGLEFSQLENLVSAKAVGVTPEFVAEMRAAGLSLEDEEDVVSAKAVGVDAEWLAGMARVGYPDLTAEQAVQLRAMDVTPEYAERMERVLAAVGE